MTHKFVISNTDTRPTEFWLEPWGDGVVVEPRQAVRLELCGPAEIDLLIETGTRRVVLWVNSGEPCRELGRLFDVETIDGDASESALPSS